MRTNKTSTEDKLLKLEAMPYDIDHPKARYRRPGGVVHIYRVREGGEKPLGKTYNWDRA